MGDRTRGRAGVALRKARLAREPLCRLCTERGQTTIATVPDHILPLAKGGEDVETNIRCLCARCHDAVTREEFGLRQVIEARGVGRDGRPTSGAHPWNKER